MIELRDLHFAYRAGEGTAFQLRIRRWRLPAGGLHGLTGASGSGKTTFLHLLAGRLPAASGSLQVAGVELIGLSEAARRRFRRRQVGILFQSPELLPYLSVAANIRLQDHAATLLAASQAAEGERLQELAARLGIADLLWRPASRLSQGEAHRVALARALWHRPQLLLADEPSASLDTESAARVLDLLSEAATAAGTTVLIATHDAACLQRCRSQQAMQDLQP